MFTKMARSQVVGMTLLRIFRPEISISTFSFGVTRMIASTTCRRSLRPSRGWAATSSLFQKLDTCVIRNRSLCTWATASEAPTEINKSRTSVESVEDELDFVTSESVGYAADREEQLLEVAEPQTAVKISLLESNIQILEQECGIAELMLDAARARNGWLYLGLDISMSSTGYAVLTPSILTPDLSDNNALQGEALIEAGEARLVEWGCISGGVDSGGDKNDVVDVGIAVEEALKDVATRCRRAVSSEKAEGDKATVWVVGVEDFMRRFLPGKSNAKSMFALAQLNGIVKYACRKHLGAKAGSFHPSTPRSFYGLTCNKLEGRNMKEIVHEFALSQEGGLDSRYDWPLSGDGSKAASSYDVTDAYLVALYSWHRDVYGAIADNEAVKARFIESFQARHTEKLLAAEQRALRMLMDGDMPSPTGKKKLKPMTERSARNAHRKLENIRLTKVYKTALLHWFKRRVLHRVTSS